MDRVPAPLVHRLSQHPRSTDGPVDRIEVSLAHAPGDRLAVCYRVHGAIDAVRVPSRESPLPPERLWAHTCLELFLRPTAGSAYLEWNFSPTGQHARFAFASYRTRAPDSLALPPEISVTVQPRTLTLDARIVLPGGVGATTRLSPTAVIEDATGRLSYWAVHHPADRPDFHHAAGFVLSLPAAPRDSA